jgi:hypothetical protein
MVMESRLMDGGGWHFAGLPVARGGSSKFFILAACDCKTVDTWGRQQRLRSSGRREYAALRPCVLIAGVALQPACRRPGQLTLVGALVSCRGMAWLAAWGEGARGMSKHRHARLMLLAIKQIALIWQGPCTTYELEPQGEIPTALCAKAGRARRCTGAESLQVQPTKPPGEGL